jgi:DNA-binding NarL/FixJ family response regulator
MPGPARIPAKEAALVGREKSTDSAAPAPIRLVVVEPRSILGVGVRRILDREDDIEIVAYVTTTDEAIVAVDEAAPDVVLVDVPVATIDATEATRRLRRGAPDSGFVVMGGDDDSSILDAAEVGATAHVAAMAEPAELVAAIRRVAGGEDPLKEELITRPDLVERIVDGIRDSIFSGPEPSVLTARELEILGFVARGAKNREIADELAVSEQTVKNHLSSIFHKLGVPNRTHAVTYAARQGWLVLDEVAQGPRSPAGQA